MPSKTQKFNSEAWSSSSDLQTQVAEHLSSDNLESALTHAFSLPGPPDPYVYRAMAAVTLPQAQRALSLGRANGLHRWYLKEPSSSSPSAPVPPTEENDLGNPPEADVLAYTSIFSPTASPSKSLVSFASNGKRDSLRAAVGAYLTSKRFLDVDFLGANPSKISKKTKSHFNPALDFWAWSCRALEWCGPCEAATRSHIAHPILPVFMHHFGCVCPSYEALEVIRLVVQRRRLKRKAEQQQQQQQQQSNKPSSAGTTSASTTPAQTPAVYDIGSGNGYWTWALRQHGLTVHAVDSGQSEFRTDWIEDTVREDGARWLRGRKAVAGSEDDVLLLVYPVVGADFTRAMLREYRGRDVVVAGTQNANGYTGFRDMTMDAFMEAEMPSWRKVAQVPLPSFAGKDEALFVFSLD